MDLNSEPFASSWLLPLPLHKQRFYLNKQKFWDAIHLRYGWNLLYVPSHCVCGASFTIDHAMVCQHGPSLGPDHKVWAETNMDHGGLTFVQHSDMRYITAGFLSKVCSDVSVEPPLQPLSGEVITPKTANRQDDARADIYDIYARGFWGQ